MRVGSDVWLNGYWQNEKYFDTIQAVIREDFMLGTPPSPANRDVLRRIEATQSVSLHIRRGDYASNPATNQYHGLLPLTYYEQAAAKIASWVRDPHFFVFSDDPRWAQEHLRLGFPTYIININDPEHGHEDLRLMSTCQHHIIANSSFSWWGAWLSGYPQKLVYAPAQWFSDPTMNAQYTLPDNWQRISTPLAE